MPQGITMQFFAQQCWKSGCCDQFETYSQWFAVKFSFSNISISKKVLKMLNISCFKQNHCISGMPQGIPMQFFVQQWWKVGCCDQFHTYSLWFAAKFSFSNFSILEKYSKSLK